MTYFASVSRLVPVPSSGRRRRPHPPNSSSSNTRCCWRWCLSPSQFGLACNFLGRMIAHPCLPTSASLLPTSSSSSNPNPGCRLSQYLTIGGAYLKYLCRALGPDPDVALPAPPRNNGQPLPTSSSLYHCFSASTITPPMVVSRTETQLHAWEEQRRWRAWVLIARHWGGTIVLNLLFLLDSRFWTLVEGMLDLFYTSMVMSMVFYGVVALSNPGYLPLHFPVQQEEEKAANEDKHRNGREGEKKEEEQKEEEEQEKRQQGVLLWEEGRAGAGQVEMEKEREPRPRMASGAGDLDRIEEEDKLEEAVEERVGEKEEKEESDEAELCAHLGEHASLTGSEEREEGGEEDDLESDSESLMLEVVEATSTPAVGSAIRDEIGGGEGEEVVRKWLRRRYCASCGAQRMPLRTHHCKECGRCVSRLDHHSLLVGNCIGAGNHLSFVLFLFFQSLHLSLALLLLFLLGLPSFLSHYNFDRGILGLLGGLSQNLLFAGPQVIIERPFSTLLFLLVAFCWCVSHAALFAQLKVVSLNLLTVEAREGEERLPYLAGGRNPFDKGCFRNVISFLSLFYQYHQERRTKERRKKQGKAGRDGLTSSFSSSSWPSAAAFALSSSLSSSSPSSSSSYPSATLASPPHSVSATSSIGSSSSSPHSSPSSSPCDSPTAALLSSSSINSFSFRSLSSTLGAASSTPSTTPSSFLTYFRRKFTLSSAASRHQQRHLHPPSFPALPFFGIKKSRPLSLPLKVAP